MQTCDLVGIGDWFGMSAERDSPSPSKIRVYVVNLKCGKVVLGGCVELGAAIGLKDDAALIEDVCHWMYSKKQAVDKDESSNLVLS
ncbi:hypothetical protein GCM10009872_62650 [Actinopolymorpha rutila]